MIHYEEVVRIICADHEITERQLTVRSGSKTYDEVILAARTAVAITAHEFIELASYPAIAFRLGYRSHSSLIDLIRQRDSRVYPHGLSAHDYAACVWSKVSEGQHPHLASRSGSGVEWSNPSPDQIRSAAMEIRSDREQNEGMVGIA